MRFNKKNIVVLKFAADKHDQVEQCNDIIKKVVFKRCSSLYCSMIQR